MTGKIPPKVLKTIKLAEISLKDFTDKAKNDVLDWFSTNPAHWIMLHKVMIAYLKNETITKNQLIKFSERSYLTSNTYIDQAVKRNYFKTLRNKKDKIILNKNFYVFTGSTVGVTPIIGKGIYHGKIDKLSSVKAKIF